MERKQAMAEIVGGVSISHAPGIIGWPDAPVEEERQAVFAAFDKVKRYVEEQKPDIIVAFLDDHFDNHYRTLMPSVSVAVADEHVGPAEQYLELLNTDTVKRIPGARARAEELLVSLVGSGVDSARMGSAEFGNNLMVPMELIRPACDIAVIPVYINVFTPPLITASRAIEVGAAVRAAVEPWTERVMFWGTGGLSHWPPFWNPTNGQENDFLTRMRKYQTEGKSVLGDDPDLFTDLGPFEIEMAEKLGDAVVNPAWDRKFMDLVVAGDFDELSTWTYADIEREGGHGGHEILNWLAVGGAMGKVPSEELVYARTPEWICGTGGVLYGPQIPQ